MVNQELIALRVLFKNQTTGYQLISDHFLIFIFKSVTVYYFSSDQMHQ